MNIHCCLDCGQPLSAIDSTTYQCPQGHNFWNNPRTGASVVFLQDGQVLMSERGIEPRKGMLSLPGGFLKYGEEPRDAAVREIKEETGLDLTDLELLGVQTVSYEENETVCSIIFLAKQWSGEPKAADDSAALIWQPLDAADTGQFAWPSTELAAKLRELSGEPSDKLEPTTRA